MFTGETSNELEALPTHSVVAGLSPAVRLARSSHTIGVLRERKFSPDVEHRAALLMRLVMRRGGVCGRSMCVV